MKKMVLALLLSAGSVYGQLADYKFRKATIEDYTEFVYWTNSGAKQMIVCDTTGGWLLSAEIIRSSYTSVECLDYGTIYWDGLDNYMVFIYKILDEDSPYKTALLTENSKGYSRAYLSK
jgi:hypothetical protein